MRMRRLLRNAALAGLFSVVLFKVTTHNNPVIAVCTSLECIACSYAWIDLSLCILATGG